MSYQDFPRRYGASPASARPDASKAEAAASPSPRAAASAARGSFPAERSQLNADDAARYEFLRALDDAEVYVTDWEAQFIASLLKEVRPLTPAMQNKIDEMQAEYGHQVPQANRPAAARAVDRSPAVPGECAYFVRVDGRQQRCGLPATHKSGNIELCDDHKRAQEEGLARLKKGLRL